MNRDYLWILVVAAFCFCAGPVAAGNSLHWSADRSRVSADIQSEELPGVLQQISEATGWQVFLEPDTRRDVSAKFKDLSPGDGLRLLLGQLNFALVPRTNAPPALFVFRTTQARATQLIQPSKSSKGARVIPNELIVRVKPGVNIDELARKLGAKVTGRIDALNTYRLEFADEASAKAARDSLSSNSDVLGIDSNYSIDRPPPPESVNGIPVPEVNLQSKENSGSCEVVVGLIDTAVGSLGSGLDKFLLPSITVPETSGAAPTELTHGTAMAQTIFQNLQKSTGGKTSVKVLPVNVYGNNATANTFDIGNGIWQASQRGANVFNLSLGGTGDSPFLHGMITGLSQKGSVFFSAAGNEPVTTPTYPAAYSEVVAVTASDPSGQLAAYANRGSFVSIMEPGTSIVTFGGQSYAVIGTSTATAFATGMAAGMADAGGECPAKVIPTLRSKFGVSLGQ
ncbi:MAG: S8 family serine peptidase [Verrucomicrobiota bacterium]